MTFIPLLGYYLMRPGKPLADGISARSRIRRRCFHFWTVRARTHHIVGWSFAFLAVGFIIGGNLRSAFS